MRWIAQVDVPAARLLDAPADLALDFGRGHRKPLVRAPHRDAEGARIFRIEIAQDLGSDGVDVERRLPGAGEVPGAKDLRQSIAHPGPVGAVAEHDLDTPLERAHLPDIEVGGRLADVPDEPRHEPGPVPALERDLLIVDDY